MSNDDRLLGLDELSLIFPLGNDSDLLLPLQQGLSLATQQLQDFAQSPDFSSKVKIAFGDSADLTEFQTAWSTGDFSALPKIEVRPAAEINGANGAYAAALDTIYISQGFLSQNADNIKEIASLLWEEMGHSVDAQVNSEDSPGDEGAIFSALVRGETLSAEQLASLKAEDDSIPIVLEEQVIEIEQQIDTSITTEVGNGADTWIVERDPNTNYGSDNRLLVKNDSNPFGNLNRKPYIRFDLSSVDNTRIETANFLLSFIETIEPPTPTFTYSVYGLNDGNPGENWDEALITWNNAPGNGAKSTLDLSQTTLLGNFSFNPSTTSSGTPLSFSDSRLTSFLKSDTNNLATLIILRNQSDATNDVFSSKENTLFEPPTLQLDLFDDSLPTVSISPLILSQPEGDSGTTAYTYTVSLSHPSDRVVTVNYSTNDGTATVANGDYTDNDGTLTFNPGESLSQKITVLVNGDTNNELDENFTITLSSVTNALLAEAQTTTITEVSGDTVEISPPPSVARGDLESNDNAVIFAESAGVLLTEDVGVDLANPGTISGNNLSSGTIASGTIVDSFYLHFDPIGSSSPGVPVSGSVTFDNEIIGIIISQNKLNLSDQVLGNTNTIYPTQQSLGDPDSVTLSENRRTLSFDLLAGTGNDPVRIITAASAEVSGIIENDDPLNNSPVAENDSYNTSEDNPITIDLTDGVLINDSDPDGDILSVIAVNGNSGDIGSEITLTSGASLILRADGTFEYNPNNQFEFLASEETATDSFEYTIDDGNGNTDTAIVNITIDGVNDAPTATDNIGAVTEDIVLNDSGNLITDDDGFARDSDPDTNDILIVSQIDETTNPDQDVLGNYGSLNWNSNGGYTYNLNNILPAVQSLGNSDTLTDSFLYVLSDGNGETATAFLNVNIVGSNDAPVAEDDTANTVEDNSVNIDVLANDSDVDTDDILSVASVTQGANGSVTIEDDNTVTYTPDANFFGTDTFTYTISDGELTDTATVSVTVTPNNEIIGTDGKDFLRGTNEDDVIRGLAGNDKILGRKGNDLIEGNEGKDHILAGEGNDIVFGGEGNDLIVDLRGDNLLIGDGGNDNIVGGINQDRIRGGTGNDNLVGGFGNDTFIFAPGEGRDFIVDFQLTKDKIGLVEGKLTFEDLSFTQQGRNTVLGVTSTQEELAVLRRIDADDLNNRDLFVTVSDISSIDDIWS